MPLVDLKAYQDWVLEREFRKKVPGVADVVSWGAGSSKYRFTVDPERGYALHLHASSRCSTRGRGQQTPTPGASYIREGQYALMGARHRPRCSRRRRTENVV